MMKMRLVSCAGEICPQNTCETAKVVRTFCSLLVFGSFHGASWEKVIDIDRSSARSIQD